MRHTSAGSKLVSVRLPAETAARVSRLARQRRISLSKLIRQALDELTKGREPSIWDEVRPLLGRGSGLGDLSTNPKYLRGFGTK